MKIYGAEICGDCRRFQEIVRERGLVVETVDITESVANLRDFLKLRDTEPVFEEVRLGNRIGIPCFVREDGTVTLDENEALRWMGEPPMDDAPACEGCK